MVILYHNKAGSVNTQFSLSSDSEGDTPRKHGNLFGEDIRFDAPVREDLTQTPEATKATEKCCRGAKHRTGRKYSRR